MDYSEMTLKKLLHLPMPKAFCKPDSADNLLEYKPLSGERQYLTKAEKDNLNSALEALEVSDFKKTNQYAKQVLTSLQAKTGGVRYITDHGVPCLQEALRRHELRDHAN